MSDREYWQNYRSNLNSRLDLLRARNGNAASALPSDIQGDMRDASQIRETEELLAAVERLLAHSGRLK